MPGKEVPEFASKWIEQWKNAAPRLQAIRDEELRRLDERKDRTSDKSDVGVQLYDRYPERHGMVEMQRWFMRRHLLMQSSVKE